MRIQQLLFNLFLTNNINSTDCIHIIKIDNYN